MKLQEIKKPTLQEFLGLDWVFDLRETLNTKFDDESWERIGRAEVGTAELGDETFQILLEPGTFVIDGFTYHFVNAAFQKIVNGKPTSELQLTGKNASKIVGAVANALQDRIQLFDFDAVIFIADDNVEERMTVYNKIAERKWTRLGFGSAIYDIDLGAGRRASLLYRRDLEKQKLDTFIEFLKAKEK
jgi:hypothetical protein